jgi:roadblock/LC7 domain-containing protein
MQERKELKAKLKTEQVNKNKQNIINFQNKYNTLANNFNKYMLQDINNLIKFIFDNKEKHNFILNCGVFGKVAKKKVDKIIKVINNKAEKYNLPLVNYCGIYRAYIHRELYINFTSNSSNYYIVNDFSDCGKIEEYNERRTFNKKLDKIFLDIEAEECPAIEKLEVFNIDKFNKYSKEKEIKIKLIREKEEELRKLENDLSSFDNKNNLLKKMYEEYRDKI